MAHVEVDTYVISIHERDNNNLFVHDQQQRVLHFFN